MLLAGYQGQCDGHCHASLQLSAFFFFQQVCASDGHWLMQETKGHMVGIDKHPYGFLHSSTSTDL